MGDPATWIAIAAITTAAASTTTSIVSASKSSKSPEPPKPPQAPKAPTVEDASAKAETMEQRRRASQTKTIYSSPLGVREEASVARKTLLGQ